MRDIWLTLTAILFLLSCEKVDDESNMVCTNDCSTVSGKVYTHGDIRLKNVLLKFKFQKSTGQNSIYTRIISKTKSNNTGQFAMDFYLKDEELGLLTGTFSLYPEKNSIPKSVFYNDYSALFCTAYDILSRDFILQKNLYLPTSKKVKIRLNNFQPITQDDYFRIIAFFPCGFDNEEVNPENGNNHNYTNSDPNKYVMSQYKNNVSSKLFEVDLALNEFNYLLIGKMKNNVYTEEILTLNVTANSNETYEFSY
jgi:hypothetical protein